MRRRRRLCPWSSWKPPKLLGHSASIAVYSTVACDARHRFGEYVVEHAEYVSIVIAKNYSRRASLARLVPWDRVGTSRKLDVPQSAPKAPARPGLSFTPLCSDWDYEEFIGAPPWAVCTPTKEPGDGSAQSGHFEVS